MSAIKVTALSFGYEALDVLDNVSFEAAEGELLAFVGPSGCGKSTLLRCICGLLRPQSGTVLVDGSSNGLPGKCSFVFQRSALMPWLDVTENVGLPFRIQGLPVPELEIERQLERLGLAGFEKHFPSQLSVGMAQRVAFARALTEKRRILLLDEPFSGLDELTKRTLATFLSTIVKEDKITSIMVTHSVHDAAFLGDRIVVLSPRPARILRNLEVTLPTPRRANLWFGRELLPFIDGARKVLEAT